MARLADLLEERSKLKDEASKLIQAAEDGSRLPSENEQKRLDAIRSEADSLEARIKNQALIDDLDRRASGEVVAGDKRWEAQTAKFSLTRAIAAQIDGSLDAGLEREVSQELARRAGRNTDGFFAPFDAMVPEKRVLTTSGDGSNLIQTSVLGNEFIDALRPSSVATRLGARVLTGLRGDVALPKNDGTTPAAAWFAENSALSAGDHSFTQVAGSPKHLGALTEISRKVLLQSSPAIEQIVRADFAAKLGAGLDLGVMKGTASGGQPRGITQTSSIHTKDLSSAAPTWANIIDTVALVEASDVPMAALGWAGNAYVKAKLRTTPKETGSPADPIYLMEGDGMTLAGAPFAVTSQLAGDPLPSPIADGELIFGAWDQVLVGLWNGVEILVNPYESTAYTKGNAQIRAILDADVMVRHPQAFVHVQNIKVD